jgi:hypothetical protein
MSGAARRRRRPEQALGPVHLAARDVQRCVGLEDRLFVRGLQEAVDLALGVVEQVDLADAELVGGPGSGALP